MAFFLDVFNKILKVNDEKIFIIFDKDGNIWFAMRDLFKALGYNNVDNRINKMDIDVNNVKYYKKIRVCTRVQTLGNIQPNKKYVNESGLYEILSKSTKPFAKTFMNKYFKEIMPEIRKTGKYILDDDNKKKLDLVNDKLINYEKELNYYYDKYEYIPSDNGYFYINIDYIIIKSIKQICYKIGYTKDIKKRGTDYKVGNFNYKLIAYIPINIDGKVLENCIKSINKPHILKKKTDTICYTSLNKLKNEILSCINLINSHICECSLCKKSYDMMNIDKHKCYKKLKFIDMNKKISKKVSKKVSKKI